MSLIKLAVCFIFIAGSIFVFNCSTNNKVNAYSTDSEDLFKPTTPKGISEGLWKRYVPANNPVTKQKVALGEALYFDKRLSADGTLSCATCHDPALAFADSNSTAIGIRGNRGARNAPTILNAMFNAAFFWDGRAQTLEEQAKQPLINPAEMGFDNHDQVVARITSLPEYRQRFSQAFGREGITIDTIVKAIAAFERTQLSGNSPFDRFIAGDRNALSDAQKRGWELFQHKAQCITCHSFTPSSPFFTDSQFHNTGVATRNRNFQQLALKVCHAVATDSQNPDALNLLSHMEGFSELGRYLVSKRAQDIGAFKTPTLRDVELTAPYMHNGSEKALLDVIKFYNRGGERNAYLDERMKPLNLTDQEMNDLVEFLRALTSDDVLRRVQAETPQTRTPVNLP